MRDMLKLCLVVSALLIPVTDPVSSWARESLTVNTYPSVAYINDRGEVDGPVAALIREVNRRLAVRTRFTFNPIQRMFKVLADHEADAAYNMSYNPKRAEKWYYSKPVHRVFYSVFARKSDHFEYKSRQDLRGYVIATYGPTNMSNKVIAFAKTIPGTRVIVENRYDTAFKKLASGRYGEKGVVYAPDAVAFGVINNSSDLREQIVLAGQDQKNLYYVVFVKALVERSFVDKFNRVLMELHASGDMAEIYRRYTGAVLAAPPSAEDMAAFPPREK